VTHLPAFFLAGSLRVWHATIVCAAEHEKKTRATAKMQNPPQTPTPTAIPAPLPLIFVAVVWWLLWSSCGAPQRLKWFASHFFTSLIAY